MPVKWRNRPRKWNARVSNTNNLNLSSVVMNACYTPAYVPSTLTGDVDPACLYQRDSLRSKYEACFNQIRGNGVDGSTVIVDGMRVRSVFSDVMPAKFPAEIGSPVLWLRQRLRSYSTYMSDELFNDALVTFVVNTDGTVSDVDFANMPRTGSAKDFDFQSEVHKQLLSMPRWEPATKEGVPVSYPVAIAMSDLR